MSDILICVITVLAILLLASLVFRGYGKDDSCIADFKDPSVLGYATNSPNDSKPIEGDNYNDYLQSVALEPAIKEQQKEWLDNLMINYQPRMYSVRDDCDTGEVKRWGLLKIDYGNVINEDQNIQVPSGRTCTSGDGGDSRWGGYGIGMFNKTG